MNKRKQIITDVLLNDNFSNVQESMNTLGFTKLQQYVDYLDDCYSCVTISKYGRIMENNKSQFKRTGVLHGGAECIEIQISHSGDAARYVSTIKFTVRDPEVTRGRWQEIRYSKRNGYAYIVKYGKRLYLHKFLRIY